jgi:hypothetical protein
MNFYQIKHSLNNKIVGIYPQVEEAVYHCDVWNDPRFVDRVNFMKTDFEPITADAILRKKAKLTDFISASNMGFTLKLLFSEKLKGIIQKNRRSGLQFYQTRLIYKDEYVHDYWVLNPYQIDMQHIDFKSSEVFLMENTFTKVEQLSVSSIEDFNNEKEKISKKGYPFSIRIDNIKITKDTSVDFFVLLDVPGGAAYIVSEKLKDEMEEAGCTGIEFMPIGLSINEWLASGGERERIYGKSW